MQVTEVRVTGGNWGQCAPPPPDPGHPDYFGRSMGFLHRFCIPGDGPHIILLYHFFVMSWVLAIGGLTRGSLHSPVRSGNLPGTVPLRPRVAVIYSHTDVEYVQCCIIASLMSMPCSGYAALEYSYIPRWVCSDQ